MSQPDQTRAEAATMSFADWCAALDREGERLDNPYGAGGVVANTGTDSWRGYYDMGYSPEDALAEDQSYD